MCTSETAGAARGIACCAVQAGASYTSPAAVSLANHSTQQTSQPAARLCRPARQRCRRRSAAAALRAAAERSLLTRRPAAVRVGLLLAAAWPPDAPNASPPGGSQSKAETKTGTSTPRATCAKDIAAWHVAAGSTAWPAGTATGV